MAKRKRVDPAAAAGTQAVVVTFLLGDEECAVPITDVHQIIRDVPITRMPNVSNHVEGVLNLRGMVVPIIDLKHLLGLGTRLLGELHRLVIVEVMGRTVGFSVDSVGGVFQFDTAEIQAAPDVVLAKVAGRYVSGVVRRGEDIVILLDIQEVLKVKQQERKTETGAGVAARMISHP